MANEVTKQPTGMSYSRNGSFHSVSWKIGDENYRQGQQWGYKRPGMKAYHFEDIGIETTAKGVLISINDIYPRTNQTMKWLKFAVRGNRGVYYVEEKGKQVKKDPGWSKYTIYTVNFNKPYAPRVTAKLDDTLNNVTTFSWTTETSDTNTFLFTDVQYQSMLVKDCSVTDGRKLTWKTSGISTQSDWRSGDGYAANSSVSITEDTTVLARGSYTRWIRVRSRGAAGCSDWRYARHVYANPKQARISSVSANTTSANGFSCKVVWKAGQSVSYPIDRVDVQYAFAVPEANMAIPNGAAWTDAVTFRDTSNTDVAVFSIDSALSIDQCLYVRVNTTHDRNVTYGVAKLAAVGRLAAPSDLNVVTNQQTYTATVSATNNSAVPGARLMVLYKHKNRKTGVYSNPIKIGIIPTGETSVTVQAPNWSADSAVAFGVYAMIGTYTEKTRADGVKLYTTTEKMNSTQLFSGGTVPTAPSSVKLSETDIPGTVKVDWNWSWAAADSAEISWSDHPDAWESTDQPQTYSVDRLYESAWNISGLATGKVWYVRVRLVNTTGDENTYGPWSEVKAIDLSSPPEKPNIALSAGVIRETGRVTATWDYISTDGTSQTLAEICEVVNGTYSSVLAKTKTAYSIVLRAANLGWSAGETHMLCVRVSSSSGKKSEWSDPQPVIIAPPVTCTIDSASSLPITQITQDGNTRNVRVLSEMPLSVTVTGASEGGTTTVAIERRFEYEMDRPDESVYNGFQGETIALYTQTGEDPISIGVDDLIGYLDDGASYTLVCTVSDTYGQSKTARQNFEVHWAHQAIMPVATAEVIEDMYAVKIIPTKPTGWVSGDTVDIYRLSQDKPELIYPNASMGVAYVDPYPALGSSGGHRIVYKTKEGDYITADNRMAWIDLKEEQGDILDNATNIIDFAGNRILLKYGVDLQNVWKKDFEETHYLGGSVQGDWNPSVERSASVSVATIMVEEQDTIDRLRRLAVYPGICHVRTFDGSSFSANIDVTENRNAKKYNQVTTFTLSVKRIEPEDYDGELYSDWVVDEEEEGE